MSDEEHHFESKADAGASKTYPQQAGTIRKSGHIVIKGRPCKVVEVSTSKTGKHGHAKCHFVAIDIFTAKKLEDIVPSSHNCDVPHVNRTDYQLIDISEDGFLSLLTENGNTKDDLRLPTDDNLLTQAGRYQNPEEHPFSPGDLPSSIVPQYKYPVVLNPAAASINFNSKIWDFYLNQVIPLLAVAGNNGEYALTASSDLNCLQAISRRIHYGNFVAEVKFRDAPHEYETTIRAQDRDALMKLLTFESVEEMILKRVEKKAMTFGQEVNLGSNVGKPKYKLDPAVVSQLYKEWIIPLTKLVQVEYLLRRLD